MNKSKKKQKAKIIAKNKKEISKTQNNEINDIEEYISSMRGISSTSVLIRDFYRALKQQKVFGLFCKEHCVRDLTKEDELAALRSHGIISIGDIAIRSDAYSSKLLRRICLLRKMFPPNAYRHLGKTISVNEALGYYAKYYFQNNKPQIKHSLIYYQFLCGMISIIIGLTMILGIIWYFWGDVGIIITAIIIAMYSIFGIISVFAVKEN